MTHAIATIDEEIFSLKNQFESVCTDKAISFEKEAEFAIQIITGNEYLLKLANANRQALRDAVTNVAAIGISLNPARKQAYLVPRKGKICLDISYFGMLDMALNSGSIKWVQSNVVYEQDQFVLNGFDKPPLHQYNPFSKERGALVGVFVVAKTADGEYLTHTMSIDMVYAIRDRSEAWKGGKTCPWRTDEVEMIKKTAIKQASKLWPRSNGCKLPSSTSIPRVKKALTSRPSDRKNAANPLKPKDCLCTAGKNLKPSCQAGLTSLSAAKKQQTD